MKLLSYQGISHISRAILLALLLSGCGTHITITESDNVTVNTDKDTQAEVNTDAKSNVNSDGNAQ